jgi:hypothetical protein
MNKINISKIKKYLKNGFYIDFFFKNFVYSINMKITNSTFFHVIDKYLSNIVFNSVKKFTQYIKFLTTILVRQNLKNIILFLIIIIVQITIIIIV